MNDCRVHNCEYCFSGWIHSIGECNTPLAAGFIGFLQLRRFQPIPETAKYFDNYNAYADAYGYADPYAGAYAGVGAIPQEQVPYPSATQTS